MADKKETFKNIEEHSTSDNRQHNDRHNENARAAASLEQETPRIGTDNL
ncbi:hypothetical protein [Rossellomorea sp. NS-SX7]